MDVYCTLQNYFNYFQITGFIQIDSFSAKDACGHLQKVFIMQCFMKNDYNILPCSYKKEKIKGDGFVVNKKKSLGINVTGRFSLYIIWVESLAS